MKVGESTPAAGVSAPQAAPETSSTAEPGKFAGVLAKKGGEVKQEADAKAEPPVAGDALPSPAGESTARALAAKPQAEGTFAAKVQAAGAQTQGAIDGTAVDKDARLEEGVEGLPEEEEPVSEDAAASAAPPQPNPHLIAPHMPNEIRTEAPRPVQEARQVRAIVQEIQTVVHPSGKMQVDIQLDSQTFEGLQIRVTRDETGKIAVQFSTQSSDVSQMLERNTAALSQSLAARGYQVAGVQIVNPALATPQAQLQAQQVHTAPPVQTPQRTSEERAFRDREQGRGGGGGRQGRDGQQQRGQR